MADARLPLAPADREWDGDAAEDRILAWARGDDDTIDVRQASRAFTYVRGEGQTEADYVSPFADIIDGEPHVVRLGVSQALGRNDQVVGISDEERSRGRTFLEGQRDRFEEDDDMADDDHDDDMGHHDDDDHQNSNERPYRGLASISLPQNILVNGSQMSTVSINAGTEEHLRLKKMLSDGLIGSISFDAITFRFDVENANGFRFRDQDMPSFAASFANMPFLRDHLDWLIDSRDGTIASSQLVGGAFEQQIVITTDRGMKSFLEGQIDRFSVGFDSEGIQCSACMLNWFTCAHWPGMTYDTGDGQQVLCELIFIKPFGVETSAVNNPAVPGTGILARLCKQKTIQTGKRQPSNHHKEIHMSKKNDGDLTAGTTDENLPATEVDTSQAELDTSQDDQLLSNVVAHVMSQIGSESSVNELAKALGIDQLVSQLNALQQENEGLKQQVADLMQIAGVLNHNVGVLAGDPSVSNQPVTAAWHPISLGLSTASNMPVPTMSSPAPNPDTVKPPVALKLDGNSNGNTDEVKAADPNDPKSVQRAQTIQKYNQRRLANN